MSDDRRTHLNTYFNAKETDELREIWENGDPDEWDEQALEIVRIILQERLGEALPEPVARQIEQIIENVEKYIQSGELDKALSESERGVQIAPDLAASYNCRGQVYDELDRVDKALSDFQAAVRLDPGWKLAWGNLRSAEMYLENEFEGSASRSHLYRALEYADNDENEKALEECELARQGMPDIALAHNYLGVMLEMLGQLEPAIEAYLKAIQFNPRFYPARDNLAEARVRLEAALYDKRGLGEAEEAPEAEAMDGEISEAEIEEILQNDIPVPGWLFLDEKAYHLAGWAGHRTRPGRSGYDPLDTDFEEAHIEGTIIRLMMLRKFRTRNPVYLGMMAIIGLSFCLTLISVAAPPHIFWYALMLLVMTSPYWVVGILIMINVTLSVKAIIAKEYDENGYTFF